MKESSIINPYTTTMGSMLKIAITSKELIKYLTSTNLGGLNYEFINTKEVNYTMLTGCTTQEKELPAFNHPVIVESVMGNTHICVDVRKYVTSTVVQPNSIQSITKDSVSVIFSTLRAMIMGDYIGGRFGVLLPIYKNMATAYAMLISKLLQPILSLTYVEKLNVEIVAAHYFYSRLTTDDTADMQESIMGRITTTELTARPGIAMVKEIVGSINQMVDGVDTLIENIIKILPEYKSKMLTTDVLVNTLNNLWYGVGNKETMVIGLEHMPTFMSMVYCTLYDNTYRRSRLFTILDENKRKIMPDAIVQNIGGYYKEKILR